MMSTLTMSASANGGLGPTLSLTTSPGDGSRLDTGRIVSRFAPERMSATKVCLNQRVAIPRGKAPRAGRPEESGPKAAFACMPSRDRHEKSRA